MGMAPVSWQTPAGGGDISPFLTSSTVVYVDDATKDFAIGGTDNTAAFFFDEALGDLGIDGALTTGGDNAVLFDDNDNAQFQIGITGNETLAADLTIDAASGTLSTAAMRVGTDLTTDGTDLFWKGTKLN